MRSPGAAPHSIPSDIDPLNGRLHLEYPIYSAALDGGFSYSLVLGYNSTVWKNTYDNETNYYTNPTTQGLGFTLHFGRIYLVETRCQSSVYPPALNPCPPEDEPDLIIGRHWYYEDQAGFAHELFATSTGGITPWFTRDGSNIKAQMLFGDSAFPGTPWHERDIDEWVLWTPDGTYYRFHQELAENLSTDGHDSWLVSDIVPGVSASGAHWVHIAYHPLSTYPNQIDTITDSAGRTISFHITNTVDGVTVPKGVVSSITVPAYGAPTATATYTLDYDVASIVHPKSWTSVSQVLLMSVTPPAGSSFATSFGYTDATQSNRGVLASLHLPTGATTEYTYSVIDYSRNNLTCDSCLPPPCTGCQGSREASFTYGVAEKRLILGDGSPTYAWTYTRSKIADDLTTRAGVAKTQVMDPFGNATIYKFQSASADGESIPLDGVLDSVDYYHGQASALNLVRSESYEYEYTVPGPFANGARAFGVRVSEHIVVDADDPNKPRKTTFHNWDFHRWRLQKHYNFDGSLYRSIDTQSYDPSGAGPGPGPLLWVPQIRTVQDATGASLVTNTYTHTPDSRVLTDRRSESDDPIPNNWIRSTYSYDATTGNLTSSSSAFKDPSSLNDLIATSTSTYTFQWGLPASQMFAGVDWKTSDRTIDKNTGLVSSTRDSAGIQTNFQYDSQGRLTLIDRPGTEVDTSISFPSPTEVRTQTGTPGTSDYSLAVAILDPLGRNVITRKTLVQGAGAIRFTDYEGPSSLVKFQSEWLPCISVSSGSGCSSYLQIPGTTSEYAHAVSDPNGTMVVDPLGRLQKITLADGTYRTYSYTGMDYSETVHGINNQTTSATTTYKYDPFGRLIAVVPPSEGARAVYAYDELDRLTRAELFDQGDPNAAPQVRTWNYAGEHPDLLSSSNTPEEGTVQYHSHTADGWLKEDIRADGAHHFYDYDPAGRLVRETVAKTGISTTVPRELFYQNSSTGNTHGAGALGRVIEEKVYEDAGINPSMSKQYFYGGLNGRLDEERVTFGFWNNTPGIDPNEPTLSTRYYYNNRGQVSELVYPAVSDSSRTPTSLRYYYSQGLLTSVQYNRGTTNPATFGPLVTSITYGSAGEPTSIALVNGVTEYTDRDLLTRPDRLRILRGTTPLWDTGSYVYDGAQNIRRIGTQEYTHDRLGRLTNSSTLTPLDGVFTMFPQQYTYDAFGNMTSRFNAGGVGGTQSFTVNPADNRLQQLAVGEATLPYTFGTNGAVTSDAMHRFDYDPAERLRVLKGMDHTVLETYDYDTNNWRVRMSSADTSHQTVFVREPAGKVLSEFARPSSILGLNWKRDYIYLSGRLLATVENTEPDTPAVVTSIALQTSPCPTGVCLGWQAVTSPDLYGYDVYRSPASDPNIVTLLSGPTPIAGTSFTDTTAATGSTYNYQIVAVDTATVGAPTSPRRIMVGDQSPPSLPEWFQGGRIICASIELSWTAATDADSDIGGYNLYRRDIGYPWPSTPRNGSSLIAGVSYIDSAGSGGMVHEGAFEYGIEVVDAAGRKSSSYLTTIVDACEPGGLAQLLPFGEGQKSPYRAIGQYSENVGFRVRFHHVDHLGTPRVTTDSSGNVVARAALFPFGEAVPSSTFASTHRFTGHERDLSSSQDYMLARPYQFQSGRFGHVDPLSGKIRDPQSWNRYSYVQNNPVDFSDPTGRFRIGGTLGKLLGWVDETLGQSADFTVYNYQFSSPIGFTGCYPYTGFDIHSLEGSPSTLQDHIDKGRIHAAVVLHPGLGGGTRATIVDMRGTTYVRVTYTEPAFDPELLPIDPGIMGVAAGGMKALKGLKALEGIGRPGRGWRVREVTGTTLREAEELFGRLSRRGIDAPTDTYPGRRVFLEGRGYIGIRAVSDSGPPTIDVNVPGVDVRKIKFLP
ncbi:MAG: RHS repeat-associated core domain-containing protein [Nitrososphaera sp.]